MARRRIARRSGRKKNLPGWLLAIAGLAVGLLVAWGASRYFDRPEPKPPAVAARAAAKKPASEPPAKTIKPHYDFYTLLPGETLLPERRPRANRTAKAEAGVKYVLQAASFGSFEDADRLKARLALSGMEASIEKIAIEGKGDFYRVRLGPYADFDELDRNSRRLSELGIKAMRVKLKTS